MGAGAIRRGVVILGCSVLVAASLLGDLAVAGAPIHVELFAHSDLGAGEAHFGEALGGSYMTMDRKRPDSDVPKSVGLLNLGAVPNERCAGSPFYPVWVGEVGGHITGDVVFEFHVVSSPGGKVEVRVWPDMSTMGCNEDYRVPSAMTVADLPVGSGRVRAVMGDVDFASAVNVMVQVTPLMPGLTQGRVLYDSKQAATSLSFDCTPIWGDTCAAYEE